MTSFIDQTYTYEGSDSQAWYHKMITGAPTLDIIRIHPRVKNSTNVPNLNANRSIGPDGCDFNAAGDITAGTRKLEVTTLSIKKEICLQDLEPIFLSQSLSDGSNEAEFLPADFARMIMEVEERTSQAELEEMIWQGDTAGAVGNHLDYIDGLRKKMLADPNVNDVTGVVLTATNIIAEISKVVTAIPKAMKKTKKREKVGIAISIVAEELYREALAANSPVHYYNMPLDDMLTFNGWKLFVLDGLPDDMMCFADFENIWLGTDLFEDYGDIKLIPMADTTGDDKIRIKARFKIGVNFGVSEEVVLYDPAA